MFINLTTIDLCPGQGGSSKPETTFSVEPTTQTQAITPPEGSVFSGGEVAAVTSSIDQNIQPGNIKSGISILGVQGTVNPQKLEETFSVAPRTTDLIVVPQEGYVFSSGVVTAVTSEIDANIEPGNIKDGVEILGVLGTYTGGVTPTGTISIPTNGTYDVTSYASAQVAVGGKDYRNQNGTVTGLADLGWDADSIGYANANTPHYSWQNTDYAVTQTNKDLYGVVNKNNKDSYKNNPDMEYVPMFDTTGVTAMNYYFGGFGKIKGIPILDTSSVTTMYNMFSGCSSLITIPLLDTSSVTTMGNMFRDCSKLTSIPLLDTSSVTNMEDMFHDCSSLTAIPALDTSSVTNMNSMFYNCTLLTSVPLLDTSSVTTMGDMFRGCSKLTSIPLLNMDSVTTMYNMFSGCSSLTTVPLLDTSSVTDMQYMFQGCSSLTTVPLLDTSSVTNMNSMFAGCTSLTTVPALDTSSVTNMQGMLAVCNILTSVNGIDFSSLTAAPRYFLQNSGSTVTHFIVKGKIDFTWNDDNGLSRLTNIDFDSVKSILQAMSRTTNANAKTMKLKRVMPDQNGELAALVTDCQTKGWTITGLTIQ